MFQMRLGDLASDATANGAGSLIRSGLAQGSLTPSQLHFALPETLRAQLSAAITSSMPDTASARCDCLLSAIPGIAAHPDQVASGRTLCMQDPDAFAQQMHTAGWDPICDGGAGAAAGAAAGGAASAMSTVQTFLGTTGGKVALGLGLLTVVGIGVAVATRKKRH